MENGKWKMKIFQFHFLIFITRFPFIITYQYTDALERYRFVRS
jgi:hypothetical protein